jgi:hypothetical protein
LRITQRCFVIAKEGQRQPRWRQGKFDDLGSNRFDVGVRGPAFFITCQFRSFVSTMATDVCAFDLLELNGEDMRRKPIEVASAT